MALNRRRIALRNAAPMPRDRAMIHGVAAAGLVRPYLANTIIAQTRCDRCCVRSSYFRLGRQSSGSLSHRDNSGTVGGEHDVDVARSWDIRDTLSEPLAFCLRLQQHSNVGRAGQGKMGGRAE